jgi:hypothetical protein
MQGKVKRKAVVALLLGVAAILAIYAQPAWQALYVHDDHAVVEHNPQIAWPPDLHAIFTGRWFGDKAAFGYVAISRPLATLTFCAEQGLGLDTPRARHVVQLLMYLLVCGLAGRLAWRLAKALDLRDPTAALAAGSGTLAFALHPAHAEVVLSLAYRPEILALLLTLLATGLLLDLRLGLDHRGTIPLLLLAFAGALLSKESALAAWLAWTAWASATPLGRQRLWKPLALLGILAATWLLWRRWNLGAVIAGTIPFADNPLVVEQVPTRLLNALDIAARAAGHLLWPFELAPDYTFDAWPVQHGWTLRAVAALTGLAGLLAVAVRAWRRAVVPAQGGVTPGELTVLAVAWLLAFWLPVSHLLFPSTVVFADRLLFAPSLPLCLAFLLPFATLIRKVPDRQPWRRLVPVLLGLTWGAWAMAWAHEGQAIAQAFRSDQSLFERGVALQPRSQRMQYDLAFLLAQRGLYAEARPHLQIAADLLPLDSQVLVLQLDMAMRDGRCNDGLGPLRRMTPVAQPQTQPSKALTDWAFRCQRSELAWPVVRKLSPRKVKGPWPTRVFALGVAAGDRDGATAWARQFGVEPWGDPSWVAAATYGEEQAGRALDALRHLVNLQGLRHDLRGLDTAARDLYQRHRGAPEAAAMLDLINRTWPAPARQP